MPKIKTHSGAKKRFKLSKNGKPIRAHANKSHILTKKSTKRKRGLRQTAVADKTNTAQIKRLIPYK
ncbi:MAG: 50S ribosomal protein L35 [Clostridia bacterium]|jgi:large subunit ribosomal protein L35|nr:50S ribosomal protein L35 [Clostridia bacterium]MBQ4571758.1 50S ribosomal protein L35 [Clostridia bacterium]MBQ4645291.1 50S ribosomal protein L35 [Clostridia bacterium]MBQ8765531.1 50S ribosomal protein L35 [Clostridia bacterium]MBR2454458.1 50S ribosomal protein L35 [Clostridia bacterium]